MDTSDSGPAAPKGGRGGGADGDGSLRDALDKIHLIASQMASRTEEAKQRIPDGNKNTEANASLTGRLYDLLKPLTEFDSTLSNELAQMPSVRSIRRKDGDGKMFRWLYNVHDRPPACLRARARPTRRHSTPRRYLLAMGSAHAWPPARLPLLPRVVEVVRLAYLDYGRPCLPGLPEGVMGHMGSLMTTMTATRLTRVNRETHQKATDETFGLFRYFAMTADETSNYEKIKKLEQMKHLGKIRTAYVDAPTVVPCVAECLEASRSTLTQLHVPDTSHPSASTNARAPGVPIDFPKLKELDVKSSLWLRYMSKRRCTIGSLECLTHLIERSPKIERLEGDQIRVSDHWSASTAAQRWSAFTAVLAKCPNITTITGIDIKMDHFGRINELKNALDQHWTKPERKDVRKKLGFVVSESTIGVQYAQGGGADAEPIGEWAAGVSCKLEWRSSRDMLTVDCSSGAADAPRARDGLYGDIARQLTAKARRVELQFGGTAPLDESWRDKLVFPKAKTLALSSNGGARGPGVLDSIPTWLTEREGGGQTAASRCFPTVERLEVVGQLLTFADLPAAPNKLSLLLGGLAAVKRVDFHGVSCLAARCELLSYLSVSELDEVRDSDRCVSVELQSGDWPADAQTIAGWELRCPHIHHMHIPIHRERMMEQPMAVPPGPTLRGKADVLSFMKLVSTVRPARVGFSALLSLKELEGDSEALILRHLRSFALECYLTVMAYYSITEAKAERLESCVGHSNYYLEMQLVAK
ncbi:unnamed protein product [Vitrella brassicaformis CCMP3155]|uniref:Uncharacterized protein n=1 Tax=Vitrella brassicaformis (strain CCMP3155) TaxID=1169540 RepID=A0A0G4EI37_VITBC|nr:unnamed protein product [Vitrella brassicaformis CCMP3155]|eukprot:CEL95907.1 unnamed protein product [Vitrella brassicaformis CCMP3155]